jgi:hypothetical protein
MPNSYTRRCRHCERWISMRQMPHGQWVVFENNEPHNCSNPPIQVRAQQPRAWSASRPSPSADEFEDFELPTPPISSRDNPLSKNSVPPSSIASKQSQDFEDFDLRSATGPRPSPTTTTSPAKPPVSTLKFPEPSVPTPSRGLITSPPPPKSSPAHQPSSRAWSFGSFIGSVIGVIGAGGFYLLSFGMLAGWAFWMWMAIHLGSFAMFLFGLLGPFAFVASILGLWSIFFGAPAWLIHLVT